MTTTATTGQVQEYRSVEYRIWYKSDNGGSLLEIAKDEDRFRQIRDRLDRRGVKYRASRYYYVS